MSAKRVNRQRQTPERRDRVRRRRRRRRSAVVAQTRTTQRTEGVGHELPRRVTRRAEERARPGRVAKDLAGVVEAAGAGDVRARRPVHANLRIIIPRAAINHILQCRGIVCCDDVSVKNVQNFHVPHRRRISRPGGWSGSRRRARAGGCWWASRSGCCPLLFFFLFQFNEPCREEEEPTKTISPGSAPDIIDMFSIWVVGMRRTVLPQRREWRGVPGIRCAFPTTKTEKKLQTKGET